MKLRFLSYLTILAAVLSSCTGLNSGDYFTQTFDGVEYKFEVIVSKMTYVRLSPVSSPLEVRGEVVLPTTANYEGARFAVTQIAEGAFRDYTGITKVILPKTLSQIEREAFAGCTSLREINVPQPLSVIGDYAFDGCASLRAFSLDASISSLGIGAFRGCRALRELKFTPSFSAIPDELCFGCASLQSIDLPSTIMSVGASAFTDCISVRSISIDSSLQLIGDYAFAGCLAVESIMSKTPTPPVCGNGAFEGINIYVPVTVPMASVEAYYEAPGWNRFATILGKY